MGTRSRKRIADGTQKPPEPKLQSGALVQPVPVLTGVGPVESGKFGEDAEGKPSPAFVLVRFETPNGSHIFLLEPKHALSFAAQIAEQATALDEQKIELVAPSGLYVP